MGIKMGIKIEDKIYIRMMCLDNLFDLAIFTSLKQFKGCGHFGEPFISAFALLQTFNPL